MTIGERIKELRKGRGLTQQQLADKLNKSHGSIASYESDRRKPSLEVLEGVADVFNVSIDYITGRSNLKHDPYNKIKEAIEEDQELLEFWEEMGKRESLKLLFKQTRNMSDAAIKDVVRFMKSVEDELRENDGV